MLAHVPDTARVLAELDRITKPGGRLLLEFYNRRSLRYFVRKMRPGISVSGERTEADVYTRFDTENEIVEAAPQHWRLAGRHGIRVATVVPQMFKLPLLGDAWAKLEVGLTRSPMGRFGGFLMLDFEKST